MENIYQTITDNPIYMIIAVLLSILIIFSIIKKMIKLLMVTAACLIIYVGYLQFTGKQIPKDVNELVEELKTGVELGVKTVKEKAEDILNNDVSKQVNEIVDTLKEKTEKLIEPKKD
ncbi:MAG: hypothetical protein HQ521_01450 [Bacteroidetes bacterium]|nr:hypothetical protein [Bacteroidota bacterium]